MSGQLAFIVHPDSSTLRHLGETLSRAGYKVLAAASGTEAVERLDTLSLLPPDVVLAPVDEPGTDGTSLLSVFREHPRTQQAPVVVLGRGEGDGRLQALRLGLTHVVPEPYESEELLLVTQLALARHRDERLLSGSLAQLPVPDLLQTLESSRRSGTVALRSRGRLGKLWLRDGRVIDAEADGVRGQEAVFAVATWEEGSFEADFGPVTVPERIFDSTSYLLLEAMRRRDESSRDDAPPFAAMTDPPPPPPRAVLAVHRALTLTAVASSYAAEHLAPALVEERLERCRQTVAERHPALASFAVAADGKAALASSLGEAAMEEDTDALVRAVAEWLRAFFAELEVALPGRFSLPKLKTLTEAVGEDLEILGFYQALGLSAATKETAS